MNLTFNHDDSVLVGSGNGDVCLWDTHTGKLLFDLSKNEGQTFATISPDRQYVVSGDENGNLIVFSINGQLNKTMDTNYNPASGQNFNEQYNTGQNGQRPNQWIGARIVSVRFIDPKHFIIISNINNETLYRSLPYAALYSLNGSKKAIKYLPLLTPEQQQKQNYDIYPETQCYVRDQAIDTSPSAHVLVMAMSQKNSTLVYHYDPATQTLKQVWAPVVQQKTWWHVW